MYLSYRDKKPEENILMDTPKAELLSVRGAGAPNKLVLGENLSILSSLINDYQGRVKLVYIDPPFATNEVFRIGKYRVSTVSKSNSDSLAYSDTRTGAEYLEFLRERLVFLRELLADDGSIYLHCDYKIGHYVKIVMDEIFGVHNFRNDISRIKCNPKNFRRKAFGNIKDLVLFYSKTQCHVWNDPREDYTVEDTRRLFRKTDQNGRRYTTIPLHAPGETQDGPTGKEWRGIKPPKGRHWRSEPKVLESWDNEGLIEWSPNGVPRKKLFMDEAGGKRVQDIWEFKDPQYPDYPTQKNFELLKRIIKTSSNAGDIVLDCFCGSGTTLLAAHALDRSWIGIDSSEAAIEVVKQRMETMGSGSLFTQEYEFIIAH